MGVCQTKEQCRKQQAYAWNADVLMNDACTAWVVNYGQPGSGVKKKFLLRNYYIKVVEKSLIWNEKTVQVSWTRPSWTTAETTCSRWITYRSKCVKFETGSIFDGDRVWVMQSKAQEEDMAVYNIKVSLSKGHRSVSFITENKLDFNCTTARDSGRQNYLCRPLSSVTTSAMFSFASYTAVLGTCDQQWLAMILI